jgi:hypothetical protein
MSNENFAVHKHHGIRDCPHAWDLIDVMLSPSAKLGMTSAKHLGFSSYYEIAILRLAQYDIATQSFGGEEIEPLELSEHLTLNFEP